jgi:hypothetical protein
MIFAIDRKSCSWRIYRSLVFQKRFFLTKNSKRSLSELSQNIIGRFYLFVKPADGLTNEYYNLRPGTAVSHDGDRRATRSDTVLQYSNSLISDTTRFIIIVRVSNAIVSSIAIAKKKKITNDYHCDAITKRAHINMFL